MALTAILAVGCKDKKTEPGADIADQNESISDFDIDDEIMNKIPKRGWLELETDPDIIAQEQFIENAYLALSGDENFDVSDLVYVGKAANHMMTYYTGEDPVVFYDLYINTDGMEYYFDEAGRLRIFDSSWYILSKVSKNLSNTARADAAEKMDAVKSFLVEKCVKDADYFGFVPTDNAFTFDLSGKSKAGEDISGTMEFAVTGELQFLEIDYYDFSDGIDEEYFQEQIEAYVSEVRDEREGSYDEIIDYSYSVKYVEVYGKIYAFVDITFTTPEYDFVRIVCLG